MQLLSIKQHKAKTARERNNRSNTSSFYSFPSSSISTIKDIQTGTRKVQYHKNSNVYTNPINYSTSIPSYTLPPSSSSTLNDIQTGTRGGQYYINSNGNKTYIKNNNSNAFTKPINPSYSTPSYSIPSSSLPTLRNIQTGPRGGQYYINSNGNKTYIKKYNYTQYLVLKRHVAQRDGLVILVRYYLYLLFVLGCFYFPMLSLHLRVLLPFFLFSPLFLYVYFLLLFLLV